MKPLHNYSRVVVALASLALTATLFLPIWRIDLWAPQYPEGLVMKIWLSKLTGDVDVINGLNHYIGMRHIKADMFPEFTYLPYVVVGFILLGSLTALLKSPRLLVGLVSLLVLGAGAALYDFWQWAYDYGHNLDPTAPIQVPGMAYQPPLIGYKALLNFGAYSMPDTGGWLFFLVGLSLGGVTIYEWFYRQKSRTITGTRNVTVVALAAITVLGCTTEADPIHYGQDACQHCKMTIVDQKFSAAYVTPKGKTFKFDDLACLINYQRENNVADSEMAQVLVADFGKPGSLIDARSATYRQSDAWHSPMGGNTAAFATSDEAGRMAGKALIWSDLSHLSHAHE
ncbi:hypothetical protein GCM10027347_57330 [Larkinella harenae]